MSGPTMLVPAPLSADPIRHALAVTRGHVGDAAKLLGVSRPTLYDRAKKIGMALADEAAAQKAVMAGEHNTVTLSMQDYLSLRAAALGHQDALTKAESMIDHLTRKYLDLLTHMKACGVSIAAAALLCLFVAVPAAGQTDRPTFETTNISTLRFIEAPISAVQTVHVEGADVVPASQRDCTIAFRRGLIVSVSAGCDAPGLSPRQAKAQPRGRAYAPNRLDVVKDVAAQCPGLVLQDHAFTDAVVMELRRRYPSENWGRNGKRGNANDPSHDAIFYPTSQSPFGGAVIDIIGAAGRYDAAPAWIDQTDPTIAAGTTGVWVAPSGRLPACLSDGDGGVDPVRPPPVVTPPPVTTDLTLVLTALARLQADVDELKNRPQPDPAPPDLGLLNEYVDDMIGNGPGDDAPNHITDVLQRLDANRAEVLAAIERVFAWLRSRGALRF